MSGHSVQKSGLKKLNAYECATLITFLQYKFIVVHVRLPNEIKPFTVTVCPSVKHFLECVLSQNE